MSDTCPDDPLLLQWEHVCAQQPERAAVIDAASGEAVSFAQVEEMACAWSARLKRFHVRQRSVTFCLPNGADWFAAYLALRRAGAVVVPLDVGAPASELARANELVGAALQVTAAGMEPLPGKRRWKQGLALVKLTSGSTGAPKPIAFMGTEIFADGANILPTMGFDADDVNFGLLPFAHSYALGNLVVPLLGFGVPVAVGSSAFPHVIAEEVARTGATVLPTVPAVLEALARTERLSLRPLRLVISAAAPLLPDLAKRFHAATGLLVHNFYGSSETGGIAYDRDGQAGLRGDTVGTSMDGVQLAKSRDGRLRVTSAAVSSYGRAQRGFSERRIYGERVVELPVATRVLADCVSFDSGGGLVIEGRADRIIKCAGVRVDLARVEQVAGELAGGEPVTSFFEPGHERIHVVFTGALDESAMRAGLRREFPRLVRRLSVCRVDEMPLTARGKIDHRALKTCVLGT